MLRRHRRILNADSRGIPPLARVHFHPMANPDPDNLYILTYPEPALRERAGEIDPGGEGVSAVVDRMIELMFDDEGIGLAAPQVGLPWRLFIAHVPPGDDRSVEDNPASCTAEPLAFFNPVIVSLDGPPEPYEEGCLSLPEIRGDVLRPPGVHLRAVGLDGKPFELAAGGLLARCILHEYDHLDGVLIIDKFTQISRMKTRSAVRRLEREAGVR